MENKISRLTVIKQKDQRTRKTTKKKKNQRSKTETSNKEEKIAKHNFKLDVKRNNK
jgi:hypothetical protein